MKPTIYSPNQSYQRLNQSVYFPPKPLRRSQRGTALIIVLSFVVLATFLVLAFVSRAFLNQQISKSSAGQMKAQQIAMAGLETVIGDLVDEMAAGSEVVEENGQPVYFPRVVMDGNRKTYPTMVPLRIGVNDPDGVLGTLIRRSSATASADAPTGAAYKDLMIRNASPVNTAAASRNGDLVRVERWNRARLIPTASPAQVTPPAAFTPPDWMIVTRAGVGIKEDGSAITAADLPELRSAAANNPNFALGRIAYTVYDIGGLLDINVAGGIRTGDATHPPTPPEEIARKGSLGFADLSVIPGILDPDALVKWRNRHSARAGSFAERKFPKIGSPDYVKYLADPELNLGHVRVHPGDQAFMGRQDLLNYVKSFPNVMDNRALPHLSTFSRALDAPSWSPTNPRDKDGNPIPLENRVNYEVEAMVDSNTALNGMSAFYGFSWPANRRIPLPNRAVGRVRIPAGTTSIKDWDGNDITVRPGDPLLDRRFPLSRINLFREYEEARQAGQDTSEIEKKIRYSFGLIPDPLSPGRIGNWLYVRRVYLPSSGGSALPLMRLMTLDEVVRSDIRVGPSLTNPNTTTIANPLDPFNEPRLPNFFELLQLGILHGEVGFVLQGNANTERQIQSAKEEAFRFVVELGANIIDQYDEDHHPTFIRLYAYRNYFGDNPQNRLVVGRENLPYLSELLTTGYRLTEAEGGTPDRRRATVFVEPELWNPNQNAGEWSGAPIQMRFIMAQGEIHSRIGSINTGALNRLSDPIDFSLFDEETTPYQIRFQYPTTDTFADPKLLHSDFVDNPGTLDNRSPENTFGSPAPHRLQGFTFGMVDAPDSILTSEADDPDGIRRVYRTAGLNPTDLGRLVFFELQYLDERGAGRVWKTISAGRMTGSTQWYGYDVMSGNVYPGSGLPRHTPGGRPFTQSGERIAGHNWIDPRFPSTWGVTFNSRATPNASIRPGRFRGPSSYQYFFYAARDPWISGVRIPFNPGLSYADAQPDETVDNRGPYDYFGYIQAYDGVARPSDSNQPVGVMPSINRRPSYFTNGLVASGTMPASDINNEERKRDRAIFLNRPFRSVAEIGFAHYGQPFKSFDFHSHLSPVSGLLDLFSVDEAVPEGGDLVVGGRFNLNQPNPVVLSALLRGAGRNPLLPGGATISPAEADGLAADVSTAIKKWGPFTNRGELVHAIGMETHGKISSLHPGRVKEREVIARALSSSADVRTWNLMIDLVAQSGRYPGNATTLSDFVISGEKRYWLSLSIDRFTGRVVASQLEPVYE